MSDSSAKIPASVRLNLCIAVGVALGLSCDNLAVGVMAGTLLGLCTPAKYFDACLLGPGGRFSVCRAAIAAAVLGSVTCISIFTVTCLTGFVVGFLRGLVA